MGIPELWAHWPGARFCLPPTSSPCLALGCAIPETLHRRPTIIALSIAVRHHRPAQPPRASTIIALSIDARHHRPAQPPRASMPAPAPSPSLRCPRPGGSTAFTVFTVPSPNHTFARGASVPALVRRHGRRIIPAPPSPIPSGHPTTPCIRSRLRQAQIRHPWYLYSPPQANLLTLSPPPRQPAGDWLDRSTSLVQRWRGGGACAWIPSMSCAWIPSPRPHPAP